MSEKHYLSIKLTDEQKDQIKHAIGKDAEALELTVEELEERLAPVAPMIRKL